MRADTLCIAMLSVILLACPIASSYELDPDEILALGGPTAELSRLILQEREECCPSGLTLDSRLSSYLERKLPEVVQRENGSAAHRIIEVNLDHYVPDYDKTSFLCIGDSEMEVIDSLLKDTSFRRALEEERYTHLVVASLEEHGTAAAVAVFLRRLVHFGLSNMAFTSDGDMSITLTGMAPGCGSICLTFHKGLEEPDDYVGLEKSSETVVVDNDGRFEVRLPLSVFGAGDYKVGAYVQPNGSATYVLAATLDVRVPPLTPGGRHGIR